ncbi:MarR family transcriptional regulator [Ruminococcaceae bacterium OttesenSCG-928-L11]|nr:MarR family transcriptional regulator [Ruminococcaceae bacterium OttesenSCG-928-L11]
MKNQTDLADRIMHLARMMRRRPSAHDHHHSHGAHRVLAILTEEEGIRTSDLAVRLDIRPSSLTEVLHRLEEQGDIRRERDEQDSRAFRIYPSDKAKEAFSRQWQEQADWRQRFNNCLTEDERAQFYALCDKIKAFLEKEQEARPPCDHHHGSPHHGRRH